jgi:hypothetical protein
VNAADPIQQVDLVKVRRPTSMARKIGRVALWLLGIPFLIILLFYGFLLFHPIPLPFVRDQARAAVLAALPDTADLELGDMALALEGAAWPVLQFSPVVYTDKKSGAKIRMDALEVGFSPVRALIGQPGATITMVGPHIQVNQDLLGPRVTSLDVIKDPNGGRPTVRVHEGQDAFPSVGISSEGLDVRGNLPQGQGVALRSDNAWLIYNLEAAAQGLSDIVKQARDGKFSRLVIRNGLLDMNDAVYGLFRQFQDIRLDLAPDASGTDTEGQFSASLAGRVMHGNVARTIDKDGTARLTASITNIDFASVVPFIDDPDSQMAIRGAGALSVDVRFNAASNRVIDGKFHVDMTGTDLRIEKDYFPIVTSIAEINWDPRTGQFDMPATQIKIGQSSATISGKFVLGLDQLFGPTVGMSITAKNVVLHPNDMEAPATPFDELTFSGWSAPLYGAVGIDQMLAVKADGGRVATKGRIDMLRKGMGFDLAVGGQGISADDLKRLWPYFMSRDSRNWFVKNVTTGTVESTNMKFSFPVGTLPRDGEDKPIPQNGVSIDIVGTGVTMVATEGMAPIGIDGKTRLQVRDSKVTISADGAKVDTDAGPIGLANAAMVMSSDVPGQRVIEISGDVSSGIPALVSLAKKQQPGALDSAKLPIDLASLGGNLNLALVATLELDKAGAMKKLDYAINGTVQDFASTQPIQSHNITGGQLAFTASQQGYRVTGKAQVDGLGADLAVDGTFEGAPNLVLSSTIDVKDLKTMGFDASQFLSGKVRFAAKPMADGSIQMAVDIKDAGLTLKDLGISKEVGVPGTLEAAIKQTDTLTQLSQINLAFGDVKLQGSLDFDSKKGLQSAEFSTFALSPGDMAQLSLTPGRDGFALRLRGDQLDLKPMLKQFFGLGEGSTGSVAATQFNQTIALNMELKRALGFYKTTAFNLSLDMTLRGSDLQKANMQAQLGESRSVSITTNPSPAGRALTVAFNDMGTLLRLLGVYSRVEGGEGSLVLNMDTKTNVSAGEFLMHNFALIDEANVAQILGNHQGSQALIAKQNKLSFRSGKIDFIRRSDRVQVTEGVLTGDTVGGTMRGFIYTDKRQYDLAGTYVPLFGLNSVFQKLPLFGPLLGGRDGEGLIGVTFAVRGPLDKPDFKINPASLLVPGAFRSLFEYRAKELPRQGQ